MPQRLNERVESVPREACRFAATFAMGEAGDGKKVPFTSLARTVDPVDHWYWGQCVHDFAGMKSAAVMPVDYCHFQNEVLGMIDKAEVTDQGLQLSGALIPFKDDDRASEVIYKAGAGVPYQASIDFDEYEIVVEDIPAGFSGDANGRTYQGPVAIFRKWELYGLGVCLRGVDEGTNVQFSRKLSGQTAAVTRFSKGPTSMDGENKTPATEPEKKKEETPAVTTTPEAGNTAETPATPSTPATQTTTAPTGATQLTRAQQLQPFVAEFGQVHGVALFSQFDTVDAARPAYTKILADKNSALESEVAKFKKGPQGETPVSSSVGGGGEAQKPGKFAYLPPNIGRFAAACRIPGKQYPS